MNAKMCRMPLGNCKTLTLWLACALLLLQPTQQSPLKPLAVDDTNSTESLYYTAGVVEFRPSRNASDVALADNLAGYLEIISSEAAEPTDIIVFPESTLNGGDTATYVPEPESATTPCLLGNTSDYSDFLVQISCAARAARKYIVINLTERSQCVVSAADPRPCAPNGLNIFNTNVVFDREGKVISRYRKWNLYGEPKNTTYSADLSSFDTDFGVVFGHFVCFDILFYEPAQRLVSMGFTDVIFTSMWFSQIPFLTGVQFQESWAYSNDVNVLAAGSSLPAVGSTGSGIYAGRAGPILSVMNTGEGERRIYVARVPKKTQNKRSVPVATKLTETVVKPKATQRLNQADITLKRDYLENYESILLDLTNASSRAEYDVCHKTFCCHFELQWHQLTTGSGGQYYTYRLGAYEGMRNEAGAYTTNAIRNCAVFTCIGEDIYDCGRIFPADVVQQPQVAFDRISIESNYQTGYPYLLMPNSLRDDLKPLAVNEFVFEQYDLLVDSEVMRHARYTLNTTTDNLLAFSIYGNFFDGEGFINDTTSSPPTESTTTVDPSDGGGAAVLLQPIILIGALAVLLGLVA
ncbi:vanin-like protein 1 [Bactrocera neohumeralis]|uniref:vanin-like protein 1 n=1 Tax=Bactrocera neohumeralis TaxID=98809 RepID=UPI002166AE1D|nr:vanin-like protein 1 [Bactrocera neohumeralis]